MLCGTRCIWSKSDHDIFWASLFVYFTWNDKIETDPTKNLDPVVVINTEEVHQDHPSAHQHTDKADRVEELGRNKERWKWEEN